MTKGFKDEDGNFHPTERKPISPIKQDQEMKKLDEQFSKEISEKRTSELKQLKGTMQVPEIDITGSNFKFKIDDTGMDLFLHDPMGWMWSGEEDQIIGFMIRMQSTEEDKDSAIQEFEKEFAEQGGKFADLKPFMLKALADDLDGLYQVSGDNGRWKFGDSDSIDSELEQEIDYQVDENSERKLELDSGDKDDLYRLASEKLEHETFEQFETKNKKWYTDVMTKAINDSDTFDDFASQVEGIREAEDESHREDLQNRVGFAVGEAIEQFVKEKNR